jgi:hypothetical protein
MEATSYGWNGVSDPLVSKDHDHRDDPVLEVELTQHHGHLQDCLPACQRWGRIQSVTPWQCAAEHLAPSNWRVQGSVE